MCIFFAIGLSFSLLLNYQISFVVVCLFLVALLLIGVLTFIYLSAFAKNILYIDHNKIEFVNLKNSSAMSLNEIYKIKIKRRTNGIIREMYIWSKNGKSIFISAFENDFERIEKIIRDSVGKDLSITEVVEPIDFDHFLFYPIFGLCAGVLSILYFDILINLNTQLIDIVFYLISIYVFILGVFFILKKPIFSRSAKKNATADFITGMILIIFSIITLLNIF